MLTVYISQEISSLNFSFSFGKTQNNYYLITRRSYFIDFLFSFPTEATQIKLSISATTHSVTYIIRTLSSSKEIYFPAGQKKVQNYAFALTFF